LNAFGLLDKAAQAEADRQRKICVDGVVERWEEGRLKREVALRQVGWSAGRGKRRRSLP